MTFATGERNVLRDLARRVADIADDPVMAERRRRWVAHNSLRSREPMMLIFPEGSWAELLPDEALVCRGEAARAVERDLRMRLYTREHFSDDTVVEKEWVVRKRIATTGWGLEPRRIASPELRGAWHIDPVIREAADLKKLRAPELSCDESASMAARREMQELFGDIMNVTLKGLAHVSFHLMQQYTALRSLEEVMLDMYAEPQMLHDAMAFLEQGNHSVIRQCVDLNLLSLNSDNTYHSSGGNGFTDEIPQPGSDPARVRPCDVWASAESQEMAQVSPEHHAEFVLAYEKRLMAPFGLTGYGCCEDLTKKLNDVLTIPHIRRISISPWADVEACAARLKGDYILSWKPNPAHLVGRFDAAAVRAYVRHAVAAARSHGCVLEIILKDTHTCERHPERFDEWTRIVRAVIEESL